MTTELAVPNVKALAAQFDAMFDIPSQTEDLTKGAGGGFTVLGFKGSRWHIKAGGDDTVVTNDDGDPRMSLPIILLKSNKNVSKVYYKGDYSEGDTDAPDCWSNDGMTPDSEVQSPVSASCQGCPNNVFGSRITEAGKKAKACSDSRRVAVVPAGDITNEIYGGPMLLRVPATSLVNLVTYAKQTAAHGIPYQAAICKVGFDTSVSYPKLTFEMVGILDDDAKAKVVKTLTTSAAKVDEILGVANAVTVPPRAAEATTQETSDVADIQKAAEAKAKKDAQAKKAAEAKAKKEAAAEEAAAKAVQAEAPAKKAAGGGGFDAAVDALVNDLDGLL